METSVQSCELRAHLESAEARDGWEAGESSRLGALLVILLPVALAAWAAIGSAVHRVLT